MGLHGFLNFPVRLAFFDGFALVMKLFAFRQREFQFDDAIFEIKLERDQAVSLFLAGPDQPRDLLFMQEQFSFARGVVVELVCRAVMKNVAVVKIYFAMFKLGETVHQIGPAIPQGFHFASPENQPCFEGALDEVLVARFFILTDDFDASHTDPV